MRKVLRFNIWKPSICMEKRENTVIYYAVGYHGKKIVREGKIIYPRLVFVIVKEFQGEEKETIVEVCQLTASGWLKIVAGLLCLCDLQNRLIGLKELDAKLFTIYSGENVSEFLKNCLKQAQKQEEGGIENNLLRNVSIEDLRRGLLKNV